MTDKGTAPRWGSGGKTILGWKIGDGYYCKECALQHGLRSDNALSSPGVVPVVQEQQDTAYRLLPCSGDCGLRLARPS